MTSEAYENDSPGGPLTVVMILESSGGGSGRNAVDLAMELSNRGHKVHLLYSQVRAEPYFLERLETLKSISTHTIPMRREPHPSDLIALLRIRRYVDRIGGADVLHGHSSKAGGLVRLVRLVGLGGTRIYTPHGLRTMDPSLGRGARLFFTRMEKYLTRYGCDALIAVSPEERDHALGLGVPRSKIHLVPNGIRMDAIPDRTTARERLGLLTGDVCVGFVGRFVYAKAPERIVEAVAPFADRYPHMKLVLVGEGPSESILRNRIRSAGLAERIIMPGPVSGFELMPAFDLLVMPSRHEAMPYVLLEGLATGLPLIATDVGGVSLAIRDGKNGFIVPQSDLTRLGASIEALVRDDGLRGRMAQFSMFQRSLFSSDRMTTSTLDVYRMAGTSGRAPLADTYASSA